MIQCNFRFFNSEHLAPIIIGLRRVEHSLYDFEWIDGTSLEVNDYSNWLKGYPTNNGWKCVVVSATQQNPTDFHWFESSCYALFYYICQREIGLSG